MQICEEILCIEQIMKIYLLNVAKYLHIIHTDTNACACTCTDTYIKTNTER